MLTFLKRASYRYRILGYPDVPDFAASKRPRRALDAHFLRLDVVRVHNRRAIELQGRAINWIIFAVGIAFLATILVEVVGAT